MASAWIVICSVLPSIRLREAAVVNLGSNAVANTLPAGGALAMGVSWAMLSSWGVSTADYVLYTMVSGIWNVFARLGLPVLALLLLMTASRPGAGLIVAAGVGLALLTAAAAGLGLLLRSESFALRAGRALQRMVAVACRLARRPVPPDVAGWLPGFRGRAGALIAARGWRITAATAASNLTLWLVLLACLRGVGLSQAQVSWQTSLAAFAFVRLLTVLPVTPGGLGITELGLIGTLAAAAGHQASAQVTAAVLLYRAVTYLPPIPLGAIACLTWRHAPALIRSSPRNAGRQRGPGMQRDTADVIVAACAARAGPPGGVLDPTRSPPGPLLARRYAHASGGSGFPGEVCETGPERTVALEGNAQFVGSRVFATPGGSERILLLSPGYRASAYSRLRWRWRLRGFGNRLRLRVRHRDTVAPGRQAMARTTG